MGYESAMHLVNVGIRPESVTKVKRALSWAGPPEEKLAGYLERAVIDVDGGLAFRSSEDGGDDPYVPYEDGTVPALYGKWYHSEVFATWLKSHAAGGRLVFHSIEADGEAWGWEFDGHGRMRELALVPVGEWE